MRLLTLSVRADWRRSPPRRDWLVDPAFSLENFDFGNQYYLKVLVLYILLVL